MTPPLPEKNIEIKVRIKSEEEFENKVHIAKNLTSTEAETIVQKDVFFNSKNGRLKLRYLTGGKSQLVQYDRPDTIHPRLSKFNKTEIDNPEILEQILTLSNGCLGVLKKTRLLFIYNNTRIHLDRVENLGLFMEFECCLNGANRDEDDGQLVVAELMNIFNIQEEDLMACSYFDELRRNLSLEQD